MMGRQQAAQAPLFYAFNLDDHVPANHLLRGIDQFLDLSDLSTTSMESPDLPRHSAKVTFWTESYLNEVYIFQCRLLDLIKFIQRQYKKDKDFTEFVAKVGDSLAEFVKEQLASLIADRGAHVHARRHIRVAPCERST